MAVKRSWILYACILVVGLVFLTGCEATYNAKELIVINSSSDVPITSVGVTQYVGQKSVNFINLLENGESIAPGESKSFFIAPSSNVSPGTSLYIGFNSTNVSLKFTYDYIVSGKIDEILATFNGTGLSVGGSNVKIMAD